jgi:hypothetical protein
MNKLAVISCTAACMALGACDNSHSGNSRYGSAAPRPVPAAQTASPSGQTYSSAAANSMPGSSGGFNNSDINGKSRNPYSTTPNTGPASSNQVSSGNVAR